MDRATVALPTPRPQGSGGRGEPACSPGTLGVLNRPVAPQKHGDRLAHDSVADKLRGLWAVGGALGHMLTVTTDGTAQDPDSGMGSSNLSERAARGGGPGRTQ